MNKRTNILNRALLLLRLTFLISLVLSLASLSGCLMDEKEEEPPPREVRWGLKIQIGKYVIDSIFPPARTDSISVDEFLVRMDSICYYEPGCDTVARTVKVYGWDPTCFSKLSMTSVMGGGSASVPVDSTGLADWSNRGLFNTGLPGGVKFYLWPVDIDNTLCTVDFDYNITLAVFFNRYTFDSWGEHGL